MWGTTHCNAAPRVDRAPSRKMHENAFKPKVNSLRKMLNITINNHRILVRGHIGITVIYCTRIDTRMSCFVLCFLGRVHHIVKNVSLVPLL